jgi:hypothetical protein
VATTALSDTDAGNYKLDAPVAKASSYTVAQKSITISGITAEDKTYNGNSLATVSSSGVSNAVLINGGLVDGDALSIKTLSGTFVDAQGNADKNVSRNSDNSIGNKSIALTSTYDGADVGNYTITDQAFTSAKINAKQINAPSVFQAASKTFDGNNKAQTAIDDAAFKAQLIGNDAVSISFNAAAATYDSSDVGTGKSVTISNVALSGANASNYSVASTVVTKNNTIKAAAPVLTPRAPVVAAKSTSARPSTDNPFKLASLDDELEENYCSASSAQSCKCTDSVSAPGVSICSGGD